VLKNKAVSIGLSVAVSLALLWLLSTRVKPEDVIATLSKVYWPAVLVYAAVALGAAWLRAWRYKRLLEPQAIGWGDMLIVTFIRNSLIDLLPARLGGLSYIYVLNRRLGFSFEAATSSFVAASVLDTLTLSPFLILAGLTVGLGAGAISVPALLAVALAFFALSFLLLWKIVPLGRFLLVVLERLLAAARLDGRAFSRLAVVKFRLTVDGLARIQQRRVLLPLFGQSILIRLAKYVSVFSLFYAILRSQGFSLARLSFPGFILGISGAELTSALPVKGLAGFGTWESAWALTFRLMGFDPRLAVISGIGVHLITNVFEYALGAAGVVILAWPYLRKSRESP
jgi:hypothetical protein